MKALFVTGTDTGVGKTFVALALTSAWREAGLRVGIMKPCETGCEVPAGEEGELFPADASLLLRESRSALSIDEVCPFRFCAPMAPAEAAALEGGSFSIEKAVEFFRQIRRSHDVSLVEGAGGLLVPYEGERTAADLASAMDLPLLIVSRIGLGTINHTWLTVECARARGLEVLGIVFTRDQDPQLVRPGPDEPRNPEVVERLCKVKVLGNIPFIPGHDHVRAREFIAVDEILARL
jgi:dethiobiotin synthetase